MSKSQFWTSPNLRRNPEYCRDSVYISSMIISCHDISFYTFISNLESVVRGKLYLFGGSSCHDATECLPGVYSFDIGEDVEEPGWKKKDVSAFLSPNGSVALCCDLHWPTCRCVDSVSDLGLLRSQWRGPEDPQKQLCGSGRQHLCVRRPAGGKSYQWPHGLQHRLRLMLQTQWALMLDWCSLPRQYNKKKWSVSHYSLIYDSN